MSLKFNINRPKISDDEIKKHQNFDQLVERFKQQSIKKARGDESWWKNKKIRYSTIIAGVTVVCTITYLSLFKDQTQKNTKHETLTTQNKGLKENNNNKATAFFKAPSAKLKTPYSAYKINNAKGGSIQHTHSTKIHIPQNSFVDKHGKEIIGDVLIEYREFHSVADVIANGIPMAYDSLGKKYNLETAGMFDIKGTQNGEAVYLKPNKRIEVNLASYTDENRFNQYYLDTVKCNWQYLKKDSAKPLSHSNAEVTKQKKSESLQMNPKLERLKNECEIILPHKIDSIQRVYTNKTQAIKKPIAPNQPMKATNGKASFKLDGSYDEFPELSTFKNVVFEVGSENKNYCAELNQITWSDVKISQGPIKGKNYVLTLSYRNRVEKLIVYPVLSGNEFIQAEQIYQEKFAEYEELLAKRVKEETRLMDEMKAKQANYVNEQKLKQQEYDREKAKLAEKYNMAGQNELANSFSNLSLSLKASRLFLVSKFGVYNSDCPHAMPNQAQVQPVFVLDQKDKFLNPDLLYLIDHSHNTVYSYNRKGGFLLNYDTASQYSICIFIKEKMFICSKEEIKNILETNGHTFKVMPLPDKADNLIDFKKYLEI